jgi:hypothetical protein
MEPTISRSDLQSIIQFHTRCSASQCYALLESMDKAGALKLKTATHPKEHYSTHSASNPNNYDKSTFIG